MLRPFEPHSHITFESVGASRHGRRFSDGRWAVAALMLLLSSTAAGAGTQPTPALRVESNAAGEIGLYARGVTIDDALSAIASKAGFNVVIDPGISRPPVNMAVSAAPVEDVLRQLLRDMSYSFVYDADNHSLRQVIVLSPSKPGVAYPQRRPVGWRR